MHRSFLQFSAICMVSSIALVPSFAQTKPKRLAIFSGGSALNPLSERLVLEVTQNVSFIVPVSDNGGSSEEIRRAIGGVAVGDIRSRLLRIADDQSEEGKAVKHLLHHRLAAIPFQEDDKAARLEWQHILEGTHPLYNNISSPYKDTIRSFLLRFNHAIMKQAPTSFDFRNGSIGNFFFSGAFLELSSIESAIFLVGSVLRVPSSCKVIPVINTMSKVNLAVQLLDGQFVVGQMQISHPPSSSSRTFVDKSIQEALPSPIQRVFYVNEDAQETLPEVNLRVLEAIKASDHIIYGMGSLYSSIIPSLVLRGVGETIASNRGKKVLLLNAFNDRETMDMSASDFVSAITDGAGRYGALQVSPSAVISHIVYLEDGGISVDKARLEEMGIHCIPLTKSSDGLYDLDDLLEILNTL